MEFYSYNTNVKETLSQDFVSFHNDNIDSKFTISNVDNQLNSILFKGYENAYSTPSDVDLDRLNEWKSDIQINKLDNSFSTDIFQSMVNYSLSENENIEIDLGQDNNNSKLKDFDQFEIIDNNLVTEDNKEALSNKMIEEISEFIENTVDIDISSESNPSIKDQNPKPSNIISFVESNENENKNENKTVNNKSTGPSFGGALNFLNDNWKKSKSVEFSMKDISADISQVSEHTKNIESILSDLKNKDLSESMIDGLSSKLKVEADGLASSLDNIGGSISDLDSGKMSKLQSFVGEKSMIGLKEDLTKVQNLLSVDNLRDITNSKVSKAIEGVQDVFENTKDSITKVMESLSNAVSGLTRGR